MEWTMAEKIKKLEEREWQKQASLNLMENVKSNTEKKFLLEACPGSGKTIWAGGIVRKMMSEKISLKDKIGSVDFTVVIVPSIAIKEDFVNSLHEDLGLDFKSSEMSSSRNFLSSPPANYHGWVITYSAMSNGEIGQRISLWRKKGLNILVVFDEVHHLSENNSWGTESVTVSDNSCFTLSMTGTPFRGDRYKISGVNYDHDLICVPDFSYKAWQGIEDGVTRRVIFHESHGEFQLEDEDGNTETYNVSDFSTQEEIARFKESIFHPDDPLMRNLLDQTNAKLDEIEQTENRSYTPAGLILCQSIGHANLMARAIKNRYGTDPLVVTHDDSKAHEKIRKFKASKGRYIVSVKMVTEGVDIKRIRTITWARSTDSFMDFCQSVGRAVRVIDKDQNENAFCFYYAFSWMETHAQNYEESQIIPAIEKGEGGNGGGGDRKSQLLAHGEHEYNKYRYKGELFSEEEIKNAIIERNSIIKIQEIHNMKMSIPSPVEIAYNRRRHLENEALSSNSSDKDNYIKVDPERLEEKMKRLSKEVNSLVERYACIQEKLQPRDLTKEMRKKWFGHYYKKWDHSSADELKDHKTVEYAEGIIAGLKEDIALAKDSSKKQFTFHI